MPSLSYGCTFSHLCASGWYFSSPKQSKKTGLEQSWPFLKRNFHSQGPRFSCCCYRIIYDYGIFTKNLSRLTCLYRYDLIVPQIAQALPSESYTQFLNLPAPPVWIVSPVRLHRAAFQRSCSAACVTGFAASTGARVLCCCVNRRRWATTHWCGPTVSLLCESPATTDEANCCSGILGRSSDGRALQCSAAEKSTVCS